MTRSPRLMPRESALGHVVGYMDHGQLLGAAAGQGVDDVESEVELVHILEGNGGAKTVLVLGGHDKVLVDALLLVLVGLGLGQDRLAHGRGVGQCVLGTEHDGVEDAVLAAGGHHAVGDGAVVVDAVALVQQLGVLAHLDLHGAADDQIALLTVVGGELDVGIEGFVAVFVDDQQGIGDSVLEVGGQVVVDHLMGLLDLLTVAVAGDDIGTELGAVALDEVGDVHAEGGGAAIQKRKVQVAGAAFAADVFLLGDAGALRHLCSGEAGDLPQVADSSGHFLDLDVQSGQCLVAH